MTERRERSYKGFKFTFNKGKCWVEQRANQKERVGKKRINEYGCLQDGRQREKARDQCKYDATGLLKNEGRKERIQAYPTNL